MVSYTSRQATLVLWTMPCRLHTSRLSIQMRTFLYVSASPRFPQTSCRASPSLSPATFKVVRSLYVQGCVLDFVQRGSVGFPMKTMSSESTRESLFVREVSSKD